MDLSTEPPRGRGRPKGSKNKPKDGISDPSGIKPLEYMLAIIRDPNAAQERRDRMAVAAAPYCHPRLIDNQQKGKKEVQQDEAKEANAAWMRDLSWVPGERPS